MIAGLALVLACHGPPSASGRELAAQVRFRPADPPDEVGRRLVADIPRGQWDQGLAAAAGELMALATHRLSALDPASTAAVAARVGYPGPARFARALTGGAFPDALVGEILAGLPADLPVDLGLASRTYGDGSVLWVVGWAPRSSDLDPIPRDLPLDGGLSLHVTPAAPGTPRLFVATPDGPVEELAINAGVDRWLDLFHVPGEYRLSLTLDRGRSAEVALVFSVFVDSTPPVLAPLPTAPSRPADPVAAERDLYAALNTLRVAHGLRPVTPFPLFEPLAREHSAWMGASGSVAHMLPGVTEGVAARAAALAHPRAEHFEDVAAAATATDALAIVASSPAHLQNLLCETCTHAAIGAALEPVLDRAPRLFVTFELLSFPNGPPAPIDHYNR